MDSSSERQSPKTGRGLRRSAKTVLGSGKRALTAVVGQDAMFRTRYSLKALSDSLQQKDVLIIHQMGKVGSTTIAGSLRDWGIVKDYSLAQTHFLSDEGLRFLRDKETEAHGSWDEWPVRTRRMYVRSETLAGQVRKLHESGSHCQVISLVRDPAAVNVSGFFQQATWWPPELRSLCDEPSAECIAALQARFLTWYPHDFPLHWFQMEMEPVFGIDVYAQTFPKQAGYQIIKGEFADLLLIKLEQLDACGSEALGEFLGRKAEPLTRSNTAVDKWYSPLYSAFKQSLQLSDDYLDQLYRSPYTTHFYTPEEVEAFWRRWARS